MDDAGVQGARNSSHWAPRLLVLAGAVALGLALQGVLGDRLEAIQSLAARDVVAARSELAHLLRAGGGLVFGLTALVGASLLASSRKALSTGVFPPPGVWSWGARSAVAGPRARTLARVSIGLGALLIACSLSGAALVFYLAERLLACRAG